MKSRSPFTPRNRHDLLTVFVALLLLAAMGGWWIQLSRQALKKREQVLAEVPAFPARDQPRRQAPPSAVKVAAVVEPKPAAPVMAPPALDAVNRFALNAGAKSSVAVIQFNALMNAPIVAKLDKCFPHTQLQEAHGLDLTRDIDRFVATDDGELMSGFFDGDPKAKGLVCDNPTGPPRMYRDFKIYDCPARAYATQASIVISGRPDNIESLVDRALDPPEAQAPADDVYGDLYFRQDLTAEKPSKSTDRLDLVMNDLLSRLSSVTLRANVWDSVALTMEASPRPNQSAKDLAATASAALAVARDQIADDDVKLSALADLAKVSVEGDQLRINLAVPMEDLVEKLNDICARREKRRADLAEELRDGGEDGEEE